MQLYSPPFRILTLVLCLAMAVLGIIWFAAYSSKLSQEKVLCKSKSRDIVSPEDFPDLPGKEWWTLHSQTVPLSADTSVGLKSFVYSQPNLLNGRTDIVAVTPWLAPIVWEGTFDPLLIDIIYKPMNLTIAATVFAVGKYVMFLQDFLETAEQHFMVNFRVHYHIFTDRPTKVPDVKLAAGRRIFKHGIEKLSRWQDISASRMKIIQNIIEERINQEADYIFCLDVDTKFHFRWGAETLDRLVGQIHPWFYDLPREQFTYERRPISTAYIPHGQGDYYYIGAMFGGMVDDVYKLVKTCHKNIEADSAKGIEAAWQEESHLNRYLLYNKPSKVLSPEYLWHDQRERTNVMKVIRFSQIIKNNLEVRENL